MFFFCERKMFENEKLVFFYNSSLRQITKCRRKKKLMKKLFSRHAHKMGFLHLEYL